MDRHLGRLLAGGDGLVTRAELLAATGSDSTLRAALRRGELVKVLHGAYADTLLLGDRWLACRAALRVAPPGAALSGLCAAAVLAPALDLPPRPRLTVGRELRLQRRDVDASRVGLAPAEVVVVDGMRVTAPLRTAVDVARGGGRRVETLVVLDALLGRTSLTPAVVEARVATLTGRRADRGLVRAAALLAEVEPKAGSPMETRTRLVYVDAGLPRPEAQVDVYDEVGGWLARRDLAYREAKLGIEYLGEIHARQGPRHADRRRRNVLALRSGDWLALEYGQEEVLWTPGLLVREAEEVLAVRAPHLLRGLRC